MPSATYALFREAILHERRVACIYDGHPRELCPVILGPSKGEEKVLAYQVGGRPSRGAIAPAGAWKCLRLARVKFARLQDGPWREGQGHRAEQTCVDRIDLDINVHVRGAR
jgi:hypothetical protein